MIKLIKLQRIIMKYVVLVTLSVFFNLAIASGLPGHFPQEYEWSGRIDDIYGQSIIIEDTTFSLSSNVSIHLLDSYNATLRNLKVGMTVGCKLTQEGELISLWEFPKSLSEATGRLDKNDINELN